MNNQNLTQFFKRRNDLEKYLESESITNVALCPSCSFPTISENNAHEICFLCGWQDDGQDDGNANEVTGGPNGTLSLTESRIIFSKELMEAEEKSNLKVLLDPKSILDNIKELRLNKTKGDKNTILFSLLK